MRSGRGWPGWVDGEEALGHSKQSPSGLTPMTQTTSVKRVVSEPGLTHLSQPCPATAFQQALLSLSRAHPGSLLTLWPSPLTQTQLPRHSMAGQSSVPLTLMSGAPRRHCSLC